jgi:hypothetical protein
MAIGDVAPQGIGLRTRARGLGSARPGGVHGDPLRAIGRVQRHPVTGRARRRLDRRARPDPTKPAGTHRRRAFQRRLPRLAHPRLRQWPLGLLPAPRPDPWDLVVFAEMQLACIAP